MKKNLLLIFLMSLCFNTLIEAQCQATFTCSAFPAAAIPGKVVIYRETTTGAKMDSVGYSDVSTSSFTIAVPDSGNYVLQYIPNSSLYQISYADTAKSWIDATVYSNPCATGSFANFFCQPYASLGGSGTGSLSGRVLEGQKYGQKISNATGTTAPGGPIGGIIVKGGKNPGAQLFAQTTTDLNGNYSFNNLPPGDYFILVDIPGLDTINPWFVTLNNNAITNLDWTADSLKVQGGGGQVSVKELNAEKHSFSVSPNPAKSHIIINYKLTASSLVKLELYNIVGHKVKDLTGTMPQMQGDYKQSISIADLKSGVYFVKLNINDRDIITKLLVTD